MTKRHAGSEISLAVTFKDDSGTEVDPGAVAFTYRIGRDGVDTSVTPVKSGTSTYTATFTPTQSGPLYGVFEGSGNLVKAIPVEIRIHPKQLPVG